MKTGVGAGVPAGRDRLVVIAMMTTRLGFVLALLLGLGFMVGVVPGSLLPLHILTGVLVLGGILLAGIRTMSRGGITLLGIGLAAGLIGAVAQLLSVLPGLIHLLLMVAAVALAEMNVAKLKKAA